jgi:hypothetical protein
MSTFEWCAFVIKKYLFAQKRTDSIYLVTRLYSPLYFGPFADKRSFMLGGLQPE